MTNRKMFELKMCYLIKKKYFYDIPQVITDIMRSQLLGLGTPTFTFQLSLAV